MALAPGGSDVLSGISFFLSIKKMELGSTAGTWQVSPQPSGEAAFAARTPHRRHSRSPECAAAGNRACIGALSTCVPAGYVNEVVFVPPRK